MTANLAPQLVFKCFDSNNNPLAGGKLYTYQSGTAIPLATYTDATATYVAPNPIILDSLGQAIVWLGSAPYTFNLLDANGVQQPDYPINQVSTIAPANPTQAKYNNSTTYSLGDVLQNNAGNASYVSLINGNTTDPNAGTFYLTASAAAGILTVTSTNQVLGVGTQLFGNGSLILPSVSITGFITGRGGVGTYSISYSSTITSSANNLSATNWAAYAGNVKSSFAASNTISQNIIATAGQTLFTLATPYTIGNNSLIVFLNGSKLVVGLDYTETSNTTITLLVPAQANDDLNFLTSVLVNALAADSSQVSYNPGGSGSLVTNVQNKLRQTVSVTDFGADPTGTKDSAAAFNSAVSFCNTLLAPYLIIPPGTYLLNSTVTFSMPAYSTVDFYGQLTSTVSAAPAVILGSTTAYSDSITVRGLSVTRTSIDPPTGSSIGVQCWDLVRCNVQIKKAYGFNAGVQVSSQQSNGGTAYSRFDLGELCSNTINLWLHVVPTSGGWVNENNFYGGNFTHDSLYTTAYPTTASVNLQIDNNTGAGGACNNNRFFAPSFEDFTTYAIAAIINGLNNTIYQPRMENPANVTGYPIQFTSNSSECGIIGVGYNLFMTAISDLGSSNYYDTGNGRRIMNTASTSGCVFAAGSYADGNAPALGTLNSSGVLKGYITGAGNAVLNTVTAPSGLVSGEQIGISANGQYPNSVCSTSGTYTLQLYTYTSVNYVTVSTAPSAVVIAMPTPNSSQNGMIISICFSATVSSVSKSGATTYGMPTTFTANVPVRFWWSNANLAWYPF